MAVKHMILNEVPTTKILIIEYTENEVVDYMAEFASYIIVSMAKDTNPIGATEWFSKNKKR